MWKNPRKGLLSLALSCWLLSLPCTSYAATYQMTEAQMQTLESNFLELETRNAQLLKILTESENELTLASSESERLKELLQIANNQLSKLMTELKEARSESERVSKSLETANKELERASESLRKSEAQHKKTESRLRTQKTLWQVLAIILGGVVATK
ncbi:MAG: hypothetical protein IJT82_03705 [Schwartzia sp.]|nr:hypothetical protein [Schwartzia sp. (in: firmicutes)]